MSAHNASFSFAARLPMLLWLLAARLGSRWWLRACFRSLAGCVPVGALVGALSDVPDALPGSSHRIGDLAFAGGAALFLVLLLWWIGKKFGGIVGAMKVLAWSYCFQQAVVVAVYGTWLAAGMNGTQPDMGFVIFTAVLALALGIPSSIALRRLDPDY
jgi:hypothetical protein